MSDPGPRTARERARADVTREILAIARRHLATHGAAALSLRAVARELGMVSSAVYRYVASRDDLLTLLIVEGYDALGAAVEAAEAAVRRDDVAGRWRAICRGVRAWALEHPHEYALLYGTPVPGYAAPEATIGPATRVPALLTTLLADLTATGATRAAPDVPALPRRARSALAPLRARVPDDVPDELVLRGVVAWTWLFGAVSFELFGQYAHVVDEGLALRDSLFESELERLAGFVGLPARAPRQRSRAGPAGAAPGPPLLSRVNEPD